MRHMRDDYNDLEALNKKIPDDEPVFLLRGQDRFAPQVLRVWASYVENGGGSLDIVKAAREQANKMDEWHVIHGSKIPDLYTAPVVEEAVEPEDENDD